MGKTIKDSKAFKDKMEKNREISPYVKLRSHKAERRYGKKVAGRATYGVSNDEI